MILGIVIVAVINEQWLHQVEIRNFMTDERTTGNVGQGRHENKFVRNLGVRGGV